MGNQRARKFVSIILAAGLVTPIAGLAAAPSEIGIDYMSVSYSDLNINSQRGAKTLYGRLQKASEEFCGVESYTVVRSLKAHADAKTCYEETLSSAVDKIDSRTLKEMHES
ncbi:MAG: UrcA family protein [Gammaproteobacteria bacterium]|nr:UrcA family protein [Gammaproteobacteria bacterium]